MTQKILLNGGPLSMKEITVPSGRANEINLAISPAPDMPFADSGKVPANMPRVPAARYRRREQTRIFDFDLCQRPARNRGR